MIGNVWLKTKQDNLRYTVLLSKYSVYWYTGVYMFAFARRALNSFSLWSKPFWHRSGEIYWSTKWRRTARAPTIKEGSTNLISRISGTPTWIWSTEAFAFRFSQSLAKSCRRQTEALRNSNYHNIVCVILFILVFLVLAGWTKELSHRLQLPSLLQLWFSLYRRNHTISAETYAKPNFSVL